MDSTWVSGYMGDIYAADGYVYVAAQLSLEILQIEGRLEEADVGPKKKMTMTWGRIKRTQLLQNYPNASNPETWIPYVLAEPVEVTIQIYSIRRSRAQKPL